MPLWDFSSHKDNGKPKKSKEAYDYQTRERQLGAIRAEELSAIAEKPGFLTGHSEIRAAMHKKAEDERSLAREKVANQSQRPILSSSVELVRACTTIPNPATTEHNAAMVSRIKALSALRKAAACGS